MFKALACAINGLTEELARGRELATKCDVEASEQRIIEAINLVCRPKPEVPRVRFQFAIGLPQNKQKGDNMPVSVKISNEQKVNVKLTPVTDTGKPAKLDGVPSWSVVSGGATLAIAEDGLSADLISADEPGDSEILVEADADLGEGVETISDVIQLSVAGATAKNLGLSVGTPQPK